MKETKKSKRNFSFPKLSIQQRLPLLICVLLLLVIIIFSWTSYIGVRNASLEVGRNRLRSLGDQLSSMFQQSAQALETATRATAEQESIKKYLLSAGKDSSKQALEVLQKLRQDTLTHVAEILDQDGKVILSSAKNDITIKANIDSTLAIASKGPRFAMVGKIHAMHDSMYFPVVASVTDKTKTKPIGFIVRWRWLKSAPKAIEQLAQLIGTNATLYFGNDDGKFWTDMITPIPSPPVNNRQDIQKVIEYSGPKGNTVVATVAPVANTNWLILLELSKKTILEAANRFLNWVVIVGAGLIIIGILIAWLMSRNITQPLNKLSAAASAIAGGDYSSSIAFDRSDELGKLARAFNAMSVQVNNAQQNLEKKVRERTSQLEEANKELESFSYSVSHDLRAPLRAINGYAEILKEEYGIKLDAEANRIINAITSNANMMGQLIDDLIAFAKMSRKESDHNKTVNMKEISQSCMTTLLQQEPPDKYHFHIGALPDCNGDENLIKQVWTNLISNAIKYSSKKSEPHIEIGSKSDNSSIVYFIRDNGVGFDMKYAHKLFGVFQRLHSQDSFEGNGIGLALVKRIIDKHKGEIWAEASPEEGAIFYFRLPQTEQRM